MVELHIIVEGGTSDKNASADTTNNVESLRQSFHQFFSRVLHREDISITMGWGVINAAKEYLNGNKSDCLYIDSDLPPAEIVQWYDKMAHNENPAQVVIIPEDRRERIFFMIQEMEAWFLKQPECIEHWAKQEHYVRVQKRVNENIKEHSLIRNKDIELIAKPSEKLAQLISIYFEKDNKTKKRARYGKLKTAPYLLDALDVEPLIEADQELQRFRGTINS
jgi:hypothetical protein